MVTMKKKIDGELQNRRIHLYSGHDSSIIPLMVALGVPRLDVPLVMPGSALLLELHEDTRTRKHSIKVAVTAHRLQTFFSDYKFINSTIPQPVFTLFEYSFIHVSSQAISKQNLLFPRDIQVND